MFTQYEKCLVAMFQTLVSFQFGKEEADSNTNVDSIIKMLLISLSIGRIKSEFHPMIQNKLQHLSSGCLNTSEE